MTRRPGPALRRWWRQRLSAAALLPLSLWFIYELAGMASYEYAAARAWLAEPSTAILLLLFIPTLFYHAQSGLQVIIEDYLEPQRHGAALIVVRGVAAAGALAAVLALAKVFLEA